MVTLNNETVLLPEKETLIEKAAGHLHDILTLSIQHTSERAALIVSDTQCPLAMTLTEAYRRCLPLGTFIHFDSVDPSEIFALFEKLKPADLVILIQSTSFRLKAFRIRVELFEKAIKVIEHPHLARMSGIQEVYYIDSLAYDPTYYRGLGATLKRLIDNAHRATVDSGGEQLIFEGPLEPAKLNVGDYSHMKNIGGQFPIGEVFTEAQDLERVNGRVRLFAFADTSFSVNKPEKPITLVVSKGRVVEALHSTPEFDRVLDNIKADEGEVWLRELGFGMNRSFTKHRIVNDIGTYERMCGIHLSLGAKHGVYKKTNFKRGDTWHHVDVFADTHLVYLDNKIIYQDNNWVV